MSDSVRPHRRQLNRLPSPWDYLGKNTGVGCHFLLQCMKVKSESEVPQSCLTFSDPMDCSPPGSSVHGIFQARVLEWGAITFSKTCLKGFLKEELLGLFLIKVITLKENTHGGYNSQCVYIDMFSLVFTIYINTINWVSLQYFIALSHLIKCLLMTSINFVFPFWLLGLYTNSESNLLLVKWYKYLLFVACRSTNFNNIFWWTSNSYFNAIKFAKYLL